MALRFLSSWLLLFSLSFSAWAESTQPIQESGESRYVANILLHSSEELNELLSRAEALLQPQTSTQNKPLVLVLHGPEAKIFQRQNYQANHALVDKAARLSALGIIDVKVCETWMRDSSLDTKTLLPFVGTVPLGIGYERELLEQQHHVYF